jgi:hypothetical protein
MGGSLDEQADSKSTRIALLINADVILGIEITEKNIVTSSQSSSFFSIRHTRFVFVIPALFLRHSRFISSSFPLYFFVIPALFLRHSRGSGNPVT